MTLPQFSIPQDKLTKYLLVADHRTGGSKARFFLAHGFSLTDPNTLAIALTVHAREHWPGSLVPSAWGERHELIGPMDLADGSQRDVLAIWEVRHGQTTARFVTAYPQ